MVEGQARYRSRFPLDHNHFPHATGIAMRRHAHEIDALIGRPPTSPSTTHFPAEESFASTKTFSSEETEAFPAITGEGLDSADELSDRYHFPGASSDSFVQDTSTESLVRSPAGPGLMPVRRPSDDRRLSEDRRQGNVDRPLGSGKSITPDKAGIEAAKPHSDSLHGHGCRGELHQTHSRMDAITGRWTLFASHRNDRPNEYVTRSAELPSADGCPFCEGNEDQTPDPLLVIGPADESIYAGHEVSGGSWGIRVIPNKFPAVDPIRDESIASGYGIAAGQRDKSDRDNSERGAIDQGKSERSPGLRGQSERDHLRPARSSSVQAAADVYPEGHLGDVTHRTAIDRASEGQESAFFPSRRTRGGHEVFIESPDHYASIADLDLSRVVSLLKVYQSRMAFWAGQPSIQYVSLFKNAGPAAGASLHHPHSQLIALTDLPQAVRTSTDRMRLHHARTGCCLQCDVLRAELKAKQRIVAVTDSLVAYCPYASYLPMLLRITTRQHLERFEDLGDSEVDELARLIRRSVGWLKVLYPDVAYNFLIHTAPPATSKDCSYHWSFELFPRLTQVAGFEWSCDLMINSTLPEVAARDLRRIAMRENPLRG
jgi:galactose-1-phosphate uridylyltransferase